MCVCPNMNHKFFPWKKKKTQIYLETLETGHCRFPLNLNIWTCHWLFIFFLIILFFLIFIFSISHSIALIMTSIILPAISLSHLISTDAPSLIAAIMWEEAKVQLPLQKKKQRRHFNIWVLLRNMQFNWKSISGMVCTTVSQALVRWRYIPTNICVYLHVSVYDFHIHTHMSLIAWKCCNRSQGRTLVYNIVLLLFFLWKLQQ